jgi:3-oxoacyl-[acyl-carrier protein] reductase
VELGLEGRVALVVGASKGIGRGIAAALAREGARVAVTSRSAERAAQAAREIPGELAGFAADSADLDGLARLPGLVEERFGAPVDVLVTNTGGPPAGDVLAHDHDAWESAYRELVLAPRALIEAALPGMRERRWGRIVNVGSSSTEQVIDHLALSSVHRMAAVGYFKVLARAVARDGVTVNTVATGKFATERLASVHGSMEEARRLASEAVPAGRLGEPGEYGDLVAFLCSERAAYLTGAVIPLDGGLLTAP